MTIGTWRSWLAPLQIAAVSALACLVVLAPDGPIAWRFWCAVAVIVACAAALLRAGVVPGGASVAAARPPRSARAIALVSIDRRTRLAFALYAAYALVVLASYAAHPSAAGWQAVGEQAFFLAVIAAVASVPRPPLLMVLLLALLCLIGMQVLGPYSTIVGRGLTGIGRSLHYKSIDQWGGYPEIGMLVSLGASALIAIVFGARHLTLGLAAALLALGLASTTAYMMSRSAMLTIAAATPWLALVAAVRFRTYAAMGALVLMLAGGIVAATRVGPAGWARLADATQVRGGEFDQRGDGWRTAVAMMRDHPVLGIGPGRYMTEHAQYSTLADSAHAYNILLHVGAELGVMGLIVYTAIWARLLLQTVRGAGRTAAGLTAFAAHALLLTFLLRSQSEHFLANLRTSFRMLLLLGILFGLAEAASRGARAVTREPSPLPR